MGKVGPKTSLVAFAVLLSMPPFLIGFPTVTSASGHDILVVIRWIDEFSRQFWEGDLYPRWLVAGNSGFGEPSFYFYPPLPFWLSAVFRGPGEGWMWPSNALATALLIGRVGGAIGGFLWLGRHIPPRWAAFGAAFYVACPFTLTIGIYVRSAYAETMALGVLPFVLLAVDDAMDRAWRGVPRLAVATAVLAVCHLPTLLLGGLLTAIYTIGCGWRTPRRVVYAVLGAALGVALAGFYLAPALGLLSLVRIEGMFEGNFSSLNWFLDGAYFRAQRRHMVLYIVFQIGCFVLAVLVFWWRRREKPRGWWGPCWAALLVGMWLMTSLSAPLWTPGSPLAKVQFPWRLMGEVSLLMAAILASAAAVAPRRLAILGMVAVIGAALLPFGWSLLDDKFLRAAPQLTAARAELNLPEYVAIGWTGPLAVGGQVGKEYAPPPRLEPADAGKILSFDWHAGQALARVALTGAAELIVPQQSFPAWRAKDGSGEALTIGTAPPVGLLRVALRAGTTSVRISRAMLPAEIIGAYVSLAGLVLLGVIGWLGRRRGSHQSTGSPHAVQ